MLPPEPAEGCTLRVAVHASTNGEPERVERKFDADDQGELVLRWLAALGHGDCFTKWRLADATRFPERDLDERAFRTATLQASGLWPSARLALRRRPTHALTIRTAREADGSCVVDCFDDESLSEVAKRACSALPAFQDGSLRASDWGRCRLVLAGKVVSGTVGAALPAGNATLFLAPPPPVEAPPTTDAAPTPGRADDVDEPPTCRICFGDEATADDPLISPCLCSGSMRHVHVSCLNAWRAAAPDARANFRCENCRYAYRIERTRVAAFLQSEAGAWSLAGFVLGVVAAALGLGALYVAPPQKRLALYRWLRVATHPGRSRVLEEVAVLGLAAVGLAVFALYAYFELRVAHAFGRPTPAAMLACWVAAELKDAKRGRALAVVGLWMAGRGMYVSAFEAARQLSHRIGDRVLEVQR